MRRIYVFSCLLIIILLCNCAYFNTFYNANKYFEKAQEVELRDNGRPAPSAISNYNKSMKKCGIILTDYPKSKWADDALFLLAKCLYFKQNYMQAIEKFDELITYYPNCEYISESKLFISQANFNLRNKDIAFAQLKDFVTDSSNKELHPKALMTLAEFYLQEDQFVLAETYLNELINKYPKSKLFEEAYFKLGIVFHTSKEYEKSNEIIAKLLNQRIVRYLKMDARYYQAYNHLLLENYDTSLKLTNSLLKAEYRIKEIPKIQILQARNYAGLGRYSDAEDLFNAIINDNNRTYESAEANYHLGDIYFLELHDYEKAIESFNQVKKQKSTSPYVEKAISRSAVASQILQFQQEDRQISTEELVNESFKLAEYYIDVLSLPDSALAVYQSIENQRDKLAEQLSFISESIELEKTNSDSTTQKLDSLYVKQEIMNNDLHIFDKKFIPFSYFIKVWLHKNIKQDSTKAYAIFSEMKNRFPENKYTYASENLINNKPIEITTPYLSKTIKEFREATDIMFDNPYAAVKKIEALSEIDDDELFKKTRFTLGYLYYFEMQDSLKAKPYFNHLLEDNPDSEYSIFIKKFYDGNSFLPKLDRLPAIEKMLEKEKAEQDSLKNNSDEDEIIEMLENENESNTDR